MSSRFEATPILVDGVLYVSTPIGRVSALDPTTGAERWTYDARVDLTRDYGDFANRGVSYWRDAKAATGTPCRSSRLFGHAVDARLIAARTPPRARHAAGVRERRDRWTCPTAWR